MTDKKNIVLVKYELTELDADFPITMPSHIVRGEISSELPHVHDCLEIGYCFDGHGIFTIDNKILPYNRGDVVVINHKEVHQFVSLPGEVSIWSFIFLDPATMLLGHIASDELALETERFHGSNFINIISKAKHPGVCNIVKELINELRHQQPGYKSIARSLVFIMLARLNRIVIKSTAENSYPKHEDLLRISPAIRYIIKNFAISLVISELAKRCHFSEPHFRKVFKATVGLAPSEYIIKFRMNAAKVMLMNSNHRIINIAAECGYPTLSSFNRHFKRYFSLSPRQYRQSASCRR